MTTSDPTTVSTAPAPPSLPVSFEAALAAQRAIIQAMMGATVPDWIQLELPIGQLKALMALAVQERQNVSGLAELLRIGKPAASILVDRLVQQGYVARTEDPGDRRRTLLALTPAGSELVSTLHQGAGERRFANWLEQMEVDDLAALTRGLQALAAIAARASASEASPTCLVHPDE